MKAFTIDINNHITAFPSASDAKRSVADGTLVFATEEDLGRVAANWSSARLVRIWNAIAGVTPVHKFTDRQTAIRRIWRATENLPVRVPDTKAKEPPTAAREGTKKAAAIALLGASPGATLDEMMAALGWQSHTVRGFLSNLNKSGIRIESFRREEGRRAYRLARINGAEPTSVADGTPESRCTDVDR